MGDDCQAPFAALLSRFAPIDLPEMSHVALQDRTDTKFVLSERQLYQALAALAGQYRVLDIDGVRLNRYRTLYFDTADLALFQQHHTRRRHRYKVRSRHYVDSRLSFLEVKRKLKGDRTLKNRMPTIGLLTRLTPEASAFLSDALPFAPCALRPALWDEYTRITLVSAGEHERLTLDLNLRFLRPEISLATDCAVALPGVAIAEVKQHRLNRNSAFIGQMRALGVRPISFSKYCAGVILLYEGVKHNRFKAKMRVVERIIREERYEQ
jgi:hypothetical protein